MTDTSIMPFGKYKGKQLADVPDDYFLWLWEQEWLSEPLKSYIAENFNVIKKTANTPTKKHYV